MFFSQEDYKKIQKWLVHNSVRDTEFNEAIIPLNGSEIIAFVQNGHNVKVYLKDFMEQLILLGVPDFLNITEKYNEKYISLSQAISLLPFKGRKIGQVITFLDEEGKWKIYQFQGERVNQWNITTLWVDLIKEITGSTIVADEEDLTSIKQNNKTVIKFKDKPYNKNDYSGLGRVYLRKNVTTIIDYSSKREIIANLLTQGNISRENTIYIIQYDYTLNGNTIIIPSNSILCFEGGSINNGTIKVDSSIRIVNTFSGTALIDGEPTYLDYLTNEEDVTSSRGILKFADKEYNPANFSGLGRVYLRKNIVDGKNILTQDMINKPNVRYIIQYDYDLNEKEITVPDNCILDFQGGSLSNGSINFNNCYINGDYNKNILLDCKGKLSNYEITPEMYGAVGDGVTNDSDIINYILSIYNTCLLCDNKNYYIDDTLNINHNFTIYAKGRSALTIKNGINGINISSNIDNIYIKNLDIHVKDLEDIIGQENSGNGININQGAQYISIIDCSIRGFNYAIYNINGTWCDKIENCKIMNNNTGIYLDGENNNNSVRKCVITHNKYGIFAGGGRGFIISESNIKLNNVGIRATNNADSVVITNNYFERNSLYSVECYHLQHSPIKVDINNCCFFLAYSISKSSTKIVSIYDIVVCAGTELTIKDCKITTDDSTTGLAFINANQGNCKIIDTVIGEGISIGNIGPNCEIINTKYNLFNRPIFNNSIELTTDLCQRFDINDDVELKIPDGNFFEYNSIIVIIKGNGNVTFTSTSNSVIGGSDNTFKSPSIIYIYANRKLENGSWEIIFEAIDIQHIRKYGTQQQRPNLTSNDVGYQYYDTTINCVIVWDGIKWINVDGSDISEKTLRNEDWTLKTKVKII